MSQLPPPLALPAVDADWTAWIDELVVTRTEAVRALIATMKSVPDAPAMQVLGWWNDIHLALSTALGLSNLLTEVHPDPAVRARCEEHEQDLHALVTDLEQDRALYAVLAGIDIAALDGLARRVLDHALRDFRRAGVDRDDDTRSELKSMIERMTELGQTFSRNIREDVRSIRIAPSRLSGLPADYAMAHPAEEDGLARITTEYPDYMPFMTFADDRAARAELAHAYLNRAWPQNDPVLLELLQLRERFAQRLGYPDWPAYDAEPKMIGEGTAIAAFIERITEAATPSARRDYAVLLERLQQDHPEVDAVTAVDQRHYAEVVRRERFDVDAKEVRRYFDFHKVQRGLLDVTGRLFGLTYTAVTDAPRWHHEVTTYDVDLEGQRIGRIHLDLHPRDGKFSHAACFDMVKGIAGVQLAEGALVCNFPRGLMEHDDVVTLFHEFGHLVHHLLAGRHPWVAISGIATEWDFVEAPSQMLEEWAWDAAVLRSFATDADGRPIPTELVARMRTAEEFGKGLFARQQMLFAAVSYRMHKSVPVDLTATLAELQARYDLCAHLPGTHMHAAFGHLAGYTSGYYTYMWSLVIAKDMFSAFDAADLLDSTVATRYRDHVLAPGGAADAADLIADFLGRPYAFDAFAAWLDRS